MEKNLFCSLYALMKTLHLPTFVNIYGMYLVLHVLLFFFSDDTKVKLHELVGTLKTSAKHGSLKNQLNRVQNQKVLSVPLPKHQKEKVKEEILIQIDLQHMSTQVIA